MSTLFRVLAPLGLTCMLAATPALAETQAPQRLVSFADLDLSTQAGQRTLQSRVMQAATQVCGRVDPGDFGPMREVITDCRNTALAGARPQMQLAMAQARDGKALAANDVKVTPAAP
jgi:UrcA family protein